MLQEPAVAEASPPPETEATTPPKAVPVETSAQAQVCRREGEGKQEIEESSSIMSTRQISGNDL